MPPLQLWLVHSDTTRASLLGILVFSLLLATTAALTKLAEQALILQFVVISMAVGNYLGPAIPGFRLSDQNSGQQLIKQTPAATAKSRPRRNGRGDGSVRHSSRPQAWV